MYQLNNNPIVPRSQLVFPAHERRFFESAARSEADQLIADLEDACPAEWKGGRSRSALIAAINELTFGKKVVSFRANDLRSNYFRDDLESVLLGAPDKFHSVVLPKVNSAAEVREVDQFLGQLERKGKWKTKLRLEVFIESAEALLRAEQIAGASDRIVGLLFGLADFAASLGVHEFGDDQNLAFGYAKQRMIVVAKAKGLHAIDNVYFPLWKEGDSEQRKSIVREGFIAKNSAAARMGMDGTWVIHPQQVELAHQCYSPSSLQVERAKKQIEWYRQAGSGSFRDKDTGEMLDRATLRVALAVLAKGLQAGLVSSDEVSAAEKLTR